MCDSHVAGFPGSYYQLPAVRLLCLFLRSGTCRKLFFAEVTVRPWGGRMVFMSCSHWLHFNESFCSKQKSNSIIPTKYTYDLLCWSFYIKRLLSFFILFSLPPTPSCSSMQIQSLLAEEIPSKLFCFFCPFPLVFAFPLVRHD